MPSLEGQLPAPAYAAISKGFAKGRRAFARQATSADGDTGLATPHPSAEARAPVERGLLCVYILSERRVEYVLPEAELKAFSSTSALVRELARRGTALLAGARAGAEGVGAKVTGGPPSDVILKPSAMRIEYKVPDRVTGVTRRVALTPSSRLAELELATSLLITPHAL